MGTVAKAASGLVAAGGVTGAAYGTYDYKTTTAEYSLSLESGRKFEFVGEKDDAQLKALVSSYKSLSSDNWRRIPKFDLEGDDNEKNKKELLDKCGELKSTSIRFKSEEEVLNLQGQIEYWCTFIVNLGEALSRREGAQIILKDDEKINRDSEWKSLFTSILGSDKDGLKSFLSISVEPSSETHCSQLKTKCNEAFDKKPNDTEYQTSLENARKYCVKSQAS